MSKYTQWYPTNVKPGQRGLYQACLREIEMIKVKVLFDGRRFRQPLANGRYGTIARAVLDNMKWRGLKQKP